MLIARSRYRRAGVAVAAVAVAAGVALSAAPAMADDAPEAPSYVLTAWIVADPADIWSVPQTLSTSIVTADPSLDQLDADLPCGLSFQIDRYLPGDVTDALLAGGVLNGPSDPAEALAYLNDGDPWKFVTTDACVETPQEPQPTESAAPPAPTDQQGTPAAPAVVVTAAPVLAETGPDVWPLLTVAGVLLAAGAVVVAFRNRKFGHQQ